MINNEVIENHYQNRLMEILQENSKFNEIIVEYNRLASYVQLVAKFINTKIDNVSKQHQAINLMKPFGDDLENFKNKLEDIDLIDFNGFKISKTLKEKEIDCLDVKDIRSIHFIKSNSTFENEKDY